VEAVEERLGEAVQELVATEVLDLFVLSSQTPLQSQLAAA